MEASIPASFYPILGAAIAVAVGIAVVVHLVRAGMERGWRLGPAGKRALRLAGAFALGLAVLALCYWAVGALGGSLTGALSGLYLGERLTRAWGSA